MLPCSSTATCAFYCNGAALFFWGCFIGYLVCATVFELYNLYVLLWRVLHCCVTYKVLYIVPRRPSLTFLSNFPSRAVCMPLNADQSINQLTSWKSCSMLFFQHNHVELVSHFDWCGVPDLLVMQIEVLNWCYTILRTYCKEVLYKWDCILYMLCCVSYLCNWCICVCCFQSYLLTGYCSCWVACSYQQIPLQLRNIFVFTFGAFCPRSTCACCTQWCQLKSTVVVR